MKCFNYFWLVVASLLMALPVTAQLPESGRYIPELDIFDQTMQQVMSFYEIEAGVLAVSKDRVVVYQRGFGLDIPENTPMRLASVEKPITAAAIRQLILDGDLNFGDRVFDLGSGTGILPHLPWQGLGDGRLANITVVDLMNHQGGWNQATAAIRDPQFKTIEIANAMGIQSPADRDDLIRYMLSEPLEYTPGTNGCMDNQGNPTFCYSNFGYMVLGRIVEEVSGMSLLDFVRTRVLTPEMWVPNEELFTGRALGVNHHPREPHYQCWNCDCLNVFNPSGPHVPCPYGGFHIEAFKGHGNLVASAVPLLTYMDNYRVAVQSAAGAPRVLGLGGVFNGGMWGTSTCMWQRNDGINIAVLFTRRTGDNEANVAAQLISSIITNSNLNWPTRAIDGFWVDFISNSSMPVGGYNYPFRTMNQALNVGAGTKIRLKPGSSSWTGVITHKVQIDAPLGTATIGN